MTDATTPTKGAVHLSVSDFHQTLQNAGTPVFVDFYADWCGPCKLAAPIVDKLADELKGKVLIAKVDVDDNHELAREYGVMSIPTVILFNKVGEKVEVVEKKIGFPGEAGYRQLLSKVLPAAG